MDTKEIQAISNIAIAIEDFETGLIEKEEYDEVLFRNALQLKTDENKAKAVRLLGESYFRSLEKFVKAMEGLKQKLEAVE